MATNLQIEQLQSELIGKRYRGASLSGISLGTESAGKVSKWLERGKNFLVFLGGTGIGKTYFCSALVPWIYGKVPTFRYWNEREFFSRLRNVISLDRGDYLKEVQWLMDDHFIMFDDLGSSGFNEWRKEVLLEAIDNRYESKLPTVFTSNLSRKQINDDLGFRAHSRLFAIENTIIEMHDAKDQRQVIRE